MTPEDYFRMGAEAMRSEIAVRLMTGGMPVGPIVAPVVLGMPLPRFQIPEHQTIGESEK